MGYQGKFSGEQIDERLTNAGDIPDMKSDIATLLSNVGKPDVITDASDFATADHSKVYAYMGTTTASYTNGHWYYYKNGAWTDGGVWGSAVAVDAELETEGAAADAKATGGAIGELKSAISYNKFAINDITSEKYETMSGTDQSGKAINYQEQIVDANQSWHILTIDVSENEAYSITAASINQGYWYLFTDGVNVVGKSNQCNVSGGTITNEVAVVPSRATQLTISYNTYYITGSIKKIVGFNVNECAELDNRITMLEDLTETTSANHDVPFSDIIIHDGYYMDTLGSDVGPYNTWRYGEYIIPENSKTITVTGFAGQAARLWVIKNENNSVIGYSEYSGSPYSFSETIDLNDYPTAKKIFVNDKKSDTLSISYTYDEKIIKGEDVYVDGESLPLLLEKNKNILNGKILCCCGDSITYGADMDAEGITNTSLVDVYQSDANGNFTKTATNYRKTWNFNIANRNNMTLYNAGVSGSTMQAIVGRAGFSIENGRYTKLPDNIDYLLIWFGWNDAAYGTLGTINDTTNETFYGGFNVVLPYLINKYPYTKIGIIVPYGTTPEHREAVRKLGNKWGVAVWDNYQGGTPLYYGKEESVGVENSIVTSNRAKFQAIGAHPNHYGHAQLGDMIEKWLRGI